MLTTPKKLVRQVLDRSIAAVAPHQWSKRAGSLLILTYHRVLPPSFHELEIVEPGMFVYTSSFETHLQLLRRDFEIVSIVDWLCGREKGHETLKPACAITFDDGWRDNAEFAFPLLRKYEVPATIFIVAGMIGTSKRFWPERLAVILRYAGSLRDLPAGAGRRWIEHLLTHIPILREGLNPNQISALIQVAKQWSDEQINRYLDEIEAKMEILPLSHDADLLDWAQLRKMIASGLISVGSHTTNHTRLTSNVDNETVRQEVLGSKTLIEQELSTPVELFCYPNGDVSTEAALAVSQNYVGACTTEFGWNQPNADSCLLRRITMHEGRSDSESAFLSRVSGWLR